MHACLLEVPAARQALISPLSLPHLSLSGYPDGPKPLDRESDSSATEIRDGRGIHREPSTETEGICGADGAKGVHRVTQYWYCIVQTWYCCVCTRTYGNLIVSISVSILPNVLTSSCSKSKSELKAPVRCAKHARPARGCFRAPPTCAVGPGTARRNLAAVQSA